MPSQSPDPDLTAYRRAFAADVVSMGGDWFTYVAMSLLAVGSDAQSSGSWALFVVAASHTVPRWVLAPFAGAACDRFDKRLILWVTQSTRAVIVAAMAWLSLRPSSSSSALVLIHALHVARMALGVLADSAQRSALPSLVPHDRLAWAHARAGVAWSALFCIGVALGGVTVAAVGVTAAFAIDALSYAIAAALLWKLPSLAPIASPTRAITDTTQHSSQQDPAQRRALVVAIAAKIPAAIVQGALFIAIARYAAQRDAIESSRAALVLGLLHAARAFGAGIGPYVLRQRAPADPDGRAATIAVVFAALSLAAFAHGAHVSIAIALLVVVGIGSGASWVHSSAAVFTVAPAHARGRIASIELSTQSVAQLGGSALACVSLGAPLAVALAALSLALLSLGSRPR